MKQQEIWKDIPGYEGYYQVSSLGRVKSLDRKVKHIICGTKTIKERILKKSLNGGGYQIISLCVYGIQKTKTVHQLVAITFLNHTPCGCDIVVDHIDNNRLNNNVFNLRLISQRENSSQEHLPSASKYVGVHKTKKKWASAIVIEGISKYLGVFDTEEEASEYYQDALKCVNEYKINSVKTNKIPQSSKYLGVRKRNNIWESAIRVEGIIKHLGIFTSEEEASEYYQDALKCVNEGRIEDIKVKKPSFSSKYKGVSLKKDTNKWMSYITVKNKLKHLGSFNTELEAYQAVQEAKSK